MQEYKYAGIDIGSNATRLIIYNIIPGNDYNDALMNKLVYIRLPLRLGGDVFVNNMISENKKKEFLQVMSIYKKLIDFYHIEHYRACATSATRSADNASLIIKEIEKETGIKIDIIDGIEESMLLYKTNLYNLPEGKTFLSADLGGGSLQITLFEGEKLLWNNSYKIGTVRILNNTMDNFEIENLSKKLEIIKKEYPDLKIIGTGGNINKISSIIGTKYVQLKDLKKLHKELEPMSILERMKKYNFRSDRADVIVPAADIYIKLLEMLNKSKIYVPKIGLADGIIRELYEKFHG